MRFLRRYNSFKTKLVSAILLPLIIVVCAAYVLVNQMFTDLFREFQIQGGQIRSTEVKQMLENYYANKGNWEGVESLIKTKSVNQQVVGRRIILTTPDGRVIASSSNQLDESFLNSTTLEKGMSLESNGQRVGILLVGPVVDNFSPRESQFLSSVNHIMLLAGAIGLALALLVGFLLLRHFRKVIAPIHALTHAAHEIQAGHLQQQVPAQSRDELGSLVQAFNQMSAYLHQSEENRRNMVADIAHELRNPIAGIQCNLELMLSGTNEPVLENIAPIYDQTLLLSRLVSDLQDISLADAGKLSLRRQPVDLLQILERITATIRPQLEEKEISLVLKAVTPLPLMLLDVARIEQAFLNLLSNAQRYAPSRSSIELSLVKKDTYVQVNVSDAGPGIPPSELPHVFQRFYRGDRSRSRHTGGAGLGLTITKYLVEAHGGEIRVRSEPGNGTTFSVLLPVTPEPGDSLVSVDGTTGHLSLPQP